MRPRDAALAKRLEADLVRFSKSKRPLPGIRSKARRNTLIEQILESVHRVEYVSAISKRKISACRVDPSDKIFDPLKAAIVYQRAGDVEEAIWLVFLFVHFGKHAKAGWRYVREIYGRLDDGKLWDWKSVSANVPEFRKWLNDNVGNLRRDGVPRGFGNHRKYQSLDAYSKNGTGAAVESYVEWVCPPRTQQQLLVEACLKAKADSRKAFSCLYDSMNSVVSL